jgi:AcrR family transcriptional regulator
VRAKTRSKPRRSAAETREHVLDVAHQLFYWHGIRATGIDRVAADAGIAPTALYRLFPSKDALVAAYIERAEQRYRAWFEELTRAGEGLNAADRLVALFDGLAEQVRPEQCRGCPFLMALTELPDPTLEAHRASVRVKQWVRGRVRRLVEELAEQRPDVDTAALADHLTLLFEGVYASVQALGAAGPARRARALARALVRPTPTDVSG